MNIFGGGRSRRGGPGASGSLDDRFEKFTERARKVITYAQEEAQALHHNYIGTEHLLLGLVREGDGVAAQVLRAQGVELNRVRAAVEHIIGRGDRVVLGEVGLTPRAKKVIELAVDEARRMNHHYVGTEHLLLGMVREGEGIAAGVLESQGLNLEKLRRATVEATNAAVRGGRIGGDNGWPTPSDERPVATSAPAASGPRSNVVACRLDDATLDAIDALVEAGIRSTRSDAAAWLIGAGIEAHRPLFERVNATVGEIRRLRVEAQAIAQQVRQETAFGAEHATEHSANGDPAAADPAAPDTLTTETSDTASETPSDGVESSPTA